MSDIVVYGVPGPKVIADVPKTSEAEEKEEDQKHSVASLAANHAVFENDAWRATPPKPGPSPR